MTPQRKDGSNLGAIKSVLNTVEARKLEHGFRRIRARIPFS